MLTPAREIVLPIAEAKCARPSRIALALPEESKRPLPFFKRGGIQPVAIFWKRPSDVNGISIPPRRVGPFPCMEARTKYLRPASESGKSKSSCTELVRDGDSVELERWR